MPLSLFNMLRMGPFVFIYRLVFATLTLAAISTEFAFGLTTKPAFSAVNFFSFFTIVSNLIACAVFFDGVLRPRASIDWWRGLAVACMAITGIVFAALLRDAEITPIPWVNAVVHEVMPVAVVAEWLIVPPRMRITVRGALLWLALPLSYLTYTLVRGAFSGWYPYPFLDVATIGYGNVALYCLCIVLAFIVVGAAVALGGNRRRARVPQ